ncbi:GNAT family N-acetyltransferase [uncultured Rhodoblastus sp.]|uniref:GNAT family N-acetyltransferase n=1 Tax=uncultured Rhodoblastus sp. TaxID=543037 RepID=UPI0025F29F2E|nr:GNAT family N-acetyltransferase [uncultured Rhodoblastus sp.]
MSFELRRYDESDWTALIALWVESWTQARPEIDFSARAPWLADLFASSLAAGAQVFVAEDDKGLAGFVMFDPARKWLEQIAVAPRAKGGGAARALLGCAKAACPHGFGLDVNADNFRALAFYRREGFVETGAGENPLSGLNKVILHWTSERGTPLTRSQERSPPR